MSETTTTPTPTNEQQDARFVDFVFSVSSQPPDDAWDEVADLIHHWAERHGLDVFGIASLAADSTGANVPAAAAPGEREAEASLARAITASLNGRTWASLSPLDHARTALAWFAQHPALAARPAPTVNAADVRAGVLAACWPNGDALDGISARTADLITASVMRHLGLTVADEERAEA